MPRAILPTSCTQALSHADADGCDSASTCRVHERLDALAPFARVSLRPQLPLEELLPLMERLAHWPSIVSAYNRASRRPSWRRSCVRNPRWRADCSEGACAGGPYNCMGILYGNSIFAPVIGSPSVQSLPMLMGVQQCLELIEEQEAAGK